MAPHPASRSTSRDLARVAVFAALIAALGLPGGLTFGVSPVPITLQTLGVMLAGAVLGARNGFLAVLLFHVLTAAGLPLLAGGRGGIAFYTVAPTTGYAWGWLLGVLVIGWGTQRLLPRFPAVPAFLVVVLGGIVVVYACGIGYYCLSTSTSLWVGIVDSLKFLPGDLAKALVTVAVAKPVHRAYPDLVGSGAGRA